MKRWIYFIAIVCFSFSLLQCTSKKVTKVAPKPVPAAVLAIAQRRWPSVTQQDLDRGQLIYTTRCARCHPAKRISRRSEKRWQGSINRMTRCTKLTPEEKIILTQYVFAAREAGVR
jgi:hypothetical protein